jgi:nitrate reductase beta subunit
MLWNNVESKPYGSYPLTWDVRLLESLGKQRWKDNIYEGRTLYESAPAGERIMGWKPKAEDYSYPNTGEDDCVGQLDKGAALSLPHQNWFFYLARICNHCTYPACLASCPRGSIYKRPEDGIVLLDQSECRGYQECVRGCPYKKAFFNPMNGVSEKCIACYPKIEQGLQPQCFLNCIGKIRLAGFLSQPEHARADNPIDYLVHIRKVALPLFPQFGLEPNIYYIPPIHTSLPFLKQMFCPGTESAVKTYRSAAKDLDLSGLLCLFGSTESLVHRWNRQGEMVSGMNENGATVVRVPLKEPLFVRAAYDSKYQVVRTNCP